MLAFVSRPGFNPNLFVTGISYKDYSAYRNDHDNPLFNRALQGRYPPGSTIKPMYGLAGLDAGVTNWERTIFDPGYYQLENDPHRYRDWKRWGHGRVDLRDAVVQSCDTYFYDMGFKLGIARMNSYMNQFSLGQPTGIDLYNESSGIMPSKQWKKPPADGPGFTATPSTPVSARASCLPHRCNWPMPRRSWPATASKWFPHSRANTSRWNEQTSF